MYLKLIKIRLDISILSTTNMDRRSTKSLLGTNLVLKGRKSDYELGLGFGDERTIEISTLSHRAVRGYTEATHCSSPRYKGR
jgi:hypothetical protein